MAHRGSRHRLNILLLQPLYFNFMLCFFLILLPKSDIMRDPLFYVERRWLFKKMDGHAAALSRLRLVDDFH